MTSSLRYIKRFLIGLITLTFALFAGCSSDSNPTGGGGGGGGGNPGGVPLASSVAPMPSGLQNAAAGSGSALGLGYFNRYNSISSYGSWFTGTPTPVRTGSQAMPADTTVDTVGALIITVVVNTAVKEIDTIISWSVVLNGSDSLNSYSDFLFISGNYATFSSNLSDLGPEGRNHHIPVALAAGPGGQFGFMTINDRATGNISAKQWSWNLDPFFVDIYAHTFSSGFINIFVESDGSGFLEYYTPGSASPGAIPTYRATWSASGTGSWTASSDNTNIDSTDVF